MRKIIRGALAALLLSAGGASAETLADALAFGYESSGLIDQNRALLRAADEGVSQAVSALRPIINWTATVQATYPISPLANPTYSTGAFALSAALGLQASLVLFDSGQRRLTIDSQKEVVLATRQQLLNVEQQVLLRIVQAYQDVRRSSEFVSLRQNNVRLITEELRAARDRFEVGEVTRTDVALAEAALASAQSALAGEQGNLARSIEEFRAAVGRSPEDLATAPPASIPQSESEAKTIALRTHPALLQARHQVAAAEIAIARAETELRPSISISGQVQGDEVPEDDLLDSAAISLQASGPIYQGGRLASLVREAMARRDAARGDLLTTARTIEQNVGNAYASLEVSRASRGAFAEQVRAAQVAFEGVREEATLGARTTLDVLDAEQDLLNARTNLVGAEIDETVASYQLLSTMGLLTARNLGLNVQLYDPTAYYNLVDDAPAALSQQGQALDRVLRAINR